jgi:hypothetical protein
MTRLALLLAGLLVLPASAQRLDRPLEQIAFRWTHLNA